MFLKQCRIENFRSIKSLTINAENKFQVLVGYNEAGKSNILKALSFLDPEIIPSENDVRDPRHDEPNIESSEVNFIFGLEPQDTKRIYDKVKLLFQAKNLNQPLLMLGKRELTLSEFCENRKVGVYEINVLDKTKRITYYTLSKDYTSTEGWRKVPVSWRGYEKFESRSFKYLSVLDYPEYKDDSTLELVKPDEINNHVGNEIIALIKMHFFNCVVWTYSEKNLLPAKIDMASFKADPNSCEPLKNMFLLAGYEEITEALETATVKKNGIKNLLARISENATSHLRKVWPEYKSISIVLSENGSHIDAGIQDEINFYSLDRRSDGFKRFMTFLLMISAKVKADYLKNTLIIIDEPDIGLHPSGVQFLREELKKISKSNIVFVATHSIFMIDKERIDNQLIVKKVKEETTFISNYSSDMLDEEVIFQAMGYSFYEMLKKKNVIFEGWSDKRTFQIWLNSTKVKKTEKSKWKDIGLVHAFGAKDVQRVANNLENFDREYIVVTDSDKPSLDWQKRFTGKGKWLAYKDLGFDKKETIEDFISEKYIIETIMSILKKEQLSKDITISPNTTFNKKLEYIKNTIKLGSEEFDRLKKDIKNQIFETLKIENIELDDLFNQVNGRI